LVYAWFSSNVFVLLQTHTGIQVNFGKRLFATLSWPISPQLLALIRLLKRAFDKN